MDNDLKIQPFADNTALAAVHRRRKIEEFEQAFAQQPGVAENSSKLIQDSTFHHQCAGVYCREFRLAKGHAVTGRVHRYPCINILFKGDVTCSMGEWPEPRRLVAPYMFISGAGEKKALYAHEDSVFLTFHATEDTNYEEMWDKFTFPSVIAFERYKRELLEHQEEKI